HVYAYARLSPDNRQIALDVREERGGVTTWDVNRAVATPFALPGSRIPIWSPTNERIAFSMTVSGKYGIYWQTADGSGTPENLAEGLSPRIPDSFLPDGSALLF